MILVRRAYPAWGGRKIKQFLAADGAVRDILSASMITAILQRHDLMDGQQPPAQLLKRFEAEVPNKL